MGSSAGEEIVDPKRDVPKAILRSGAAIFILYVIGTFGILAVLPLEKISIVTGVIDSIIAVGEAFGTIGRALIVISGILILYSFFANMVTWTMGANRVLAMTAEDGNMPKAFGHLHPKFKTPDYAYIITGILGTIFLIGNAIPSESIANIFWTLFAVSSLIFLIPYLFLFPAFLKLRKDRPDVERPYVAPGGKLGAWIYAILGEFFIGLSCAFFFLPPEEIENVFIYEAELVGITVAVLIVGYLLYAWSKKKYSR